MIVEDQKSKDVPGLQSVLIFISTPAYFSLATIPTYHKSSLKRSGIPLSLSFAFLNINWTGGGSSAVEDDYKILLLEHVVEFVFYTVDCG